MESDHQITIKEEIELMVLLFLHGMAMAAWFVPLTSVLASANLGGIIPWAFAASSVAALASPLFFGAMADRSVPPAKVLRWTSAVTAMVVLLIAWALERQVPSWAILWMIQFQSLFCSPTSSLAGSIVFSQLSGSKRSFGTIRSLGTIGWMVGCWTVSALELDSSPKAFCVSGLLWLLLAIATLRIPHASVAGFTSHRLSLRERFGWDALSLLRNHDHRVVFLTAAFIAVPFAAFYPFTPPHLSSLGLDRTSAWMSLGQISEVISLVCMGAILSKWKFKSVVCVGIGLGVLRYLFYASNSTVWVLIGLALHGVVFTLTFIRTQIYLAEQIEAQWRTRAQSLLSLMTGGFGNFAGYLFCGTWLNRCRTNESVNWSVYWLGLSLLVLAVFAYFATTYHGTKRTIQTPRIRE